MTNKNLGESYHGYVTPQGIAAEKAREARVEALLPKIIAIIIAQGSMPMSQLNKELSSHSKNDISEAVWQLIDRKIVQITETRHLIVTI